MNKRLISALILLIILPACAPRYDRQAMLSQTVQDVILPTHAGFADAAAGLSDAASGFAAAPDAAGLEKVRQAWLDAALAWQRTRIYAFGETLPLHESIDPSPINPSLIEAAIAGETPVDEAVVENAGPSTKGLGAMEYLLFSRESSDEEILAGYGDGQRAAYLAALASNLKTHADTLLAFWSPDGKDFAGELDTTRSDEFDVQESIHMLTDVLVAGAERLEHDSLGRPLGKSSYGDPHPEFAEAYLSGESLAFAAAGVEEMQSVFQAGLEEYLVFLGGVETAEAINAQFDLVLGDLAAIDGTLSDAVLAHPEQVDEAYESLEDLVMLLETDMSNLLGLSVDASGSDGD